MLSFVGVCAHSLSRVRLFVSPWTVARQAPLPMEFSRQVYWSGVPFPTLGDLLDAGIKPAFLVSPALAGRFFTTNATMTSWVAQVVKHLLAMGVTWVQSLGWEDLLEKGMATHSSTHAWKIPYQLPLAGYSPWCRKESDTTEQLH